MLMRVSGPLKLKRALELIQILLEKLGGYATSGYEEQDFYMPYETTEALVEKGLIKELLSGAPVMMKAVEPVEETVEIVEPVEETVEEPVEEPVEETVEETTEEVAVTEEMEEPYEPTVEETLAPVEPVEETESETEEFDETFEEESEETAIQVRENVGVAFGVTCTFKPYYEGYERDGVLAIPVSKERFEKFKEKKQMRIFARAQKKREKKFKKQKND